jgi:NitT/TauT family transport system substrate-binding protein
MPRSVLEASIPFSNLVAVRADAARDEVRRYFETIHADDEDILGGRLPDDGFFL